MYLDEMTDKSYCYHPAAYEKEIIFEYPQMSRPEWCPFIGKNVSILIRGVKIPKLYETYKIRFVESNGKILVGFCPLQSTAFRPVGEVIEVPTPHGRLIDEREAYDKIAEVAGEESGNYVDMDTVGRGLECTPTIIESEEYDE